MKHIQFILILLVFNLTGIRAQQLLSKEAALSLTLENNFGIEMTRNINEINKNNSELLNSGFLPNIALSGGGNFTASDSEISFPEQFLEDGTPRPSVNLNDQEARRYSAGVNLNYTLFDGLGRKFNYKRLKEQYSFSELQLRETI